MASGEKRRHPFPPHPIHLSPPHVRYYSNLNPQTIPSTSLGREQRKAKRRCFMGKAKVVTSFDVLMYASVIACLAGRDVR